MDGDLETTYVPTIIHVESVDCYSIRIMVEILSDFCNTPTLKFTPDEFRITESNAKDCILMDYVIYGEWLKAYIFDLKNGNNQAVETYPFKVNAEDFLGAIKGTEGKKAPLIFNVDIDNDGSNKGLYVNMISGNEYVKTFGFQDPIIEFRDVFEIDYAGCRPSTKVSSAAFSQMITRFKTRKCTLIKFVLCKDGKIFLQGLKNNQIISSNYLDDAGDNGTPVAEQVIHNIRVNLADSIWLAKLKTLAPASVVQVYLKMTTPLVIRAHIGTQGLAIYTFRDDPHVSK